MDFNLKTYKCFKINNYFRTIKLFFFFHGISLNHEHWIKTEQILINNQLQYFKVFNTILLNTLKNSVFKNLINLIHGPVIIICNKNTLVKNQLENVNTLISLLCLKLNNKVYSQQQIRNIKKLTYEKNVFLLYKSMNNCIKIHLSLFKFNNEIISSK
jgi:hypothetical protein